MEVNFVREAKKMKWSFYHIISEAITNSIDAEATTVEVNFKYEESGVNATLDQRLVGLVIKDNGTGLTKVNQESFSLLYTEHKSLGKGSGRLSFVKFFKTIKIESVYKEENSYFKVDFSFDESFKKGRIKPIKLEGKHEAYFKLDFSKIRDMKKIDPVEKIIQDSKETVMPLLLTKTEVNYAILFGKERWEYKVKGINEKNFLINGEKFSLAYCVNNNGGEKYQVAGLVSNGRLIENPKEMHKNLPESLQKFNYLFFIKGKFIDERVKEDRSGLDFKRIKQETLRLTMDNPDTTPQKEINNAILVSGCISKIYEALSEVSILEIKEELRAIKEIYANSPYLQHIVPDNVGIVSQQAIKDGHAAFQKKSNERLSEFVKDLIKNQSKSVTEAGLIERFKKVSEETKDNLAVYIFYRDEVTKALKNKVQEKGIEKELHSIIVPTSTQNKADGKTSIFERMGYSNLWLLDDAYMSYRYVASDITISKIVESVAGKETGSSKRPDIFMAFDGDRSKAAQGLVVEFKKYDDNEYDDLKGAGQLRDYISKIREQVSSIGLSHGYLITELKEPDVEKLISDDYFKVFTATGIKLVKHYSNAKCTVTVMDWDALIETALERNKTFFEILNNDHIKD